MTVRECKLLSAIRKWFAETKGKIENARMKTYIRIRKAKNKWKTKWQSILPKLRSKCCK